MANGNGSGGNGNIRMTWTVVLPVSALGLLGALLLNVSRDAQIALNVVEQHGAEILHLRAEIRVLEEDMRDRTQMRWTSEQAAEAHRYIQKDIQACFDSLQAHEKSRHE